MCDLVHYQYAVDIQQLIAKALNAGFSTEFPPVTGHFTIKHKNMFTIWRLTSGTWLEIHPLSIVFNIESDKLIVYTGSALKQNKSIATIDPNNHNKIFKLIKKKAFYLYLTASVCDILGYVSQWLPNRKK